MFSTNKEITSSRRNDTNFLRAVAICLIINSHMDDFYPIKFLATGGMIGNAMFFMLSSLGLYLSWQNKGKSDFVTWYSCRISRIYPSVWATIILVIFPYDIYFGLFRSGTFLSEMGKFFFPPFWFLQALLIYYFFIYFVLERFSHKYLLGVAISVFLFYIMYYVIFLDLTTFSIESHFFRVIFYFLIVLWGLYLGSIKEKVHFEGWRDILFLVLFVGIIYLHKFYMYRGMFPQIQFVQHLAVFPLLYYSLKFAKSDFIMTTVMNNSFWGKPINFISMITLELFIINNTIDIFVGQLNLDFPLNVILFVITNIILATIIYYCSQYLRRILVSHEVK